MNRNNKNSCTPPHMLIKSVVNKVNNFTNFRNNRNSWDLGNQDYLDQEFTKSWITKAVIQKPQNNNQESFINRNLLTISNIIENHKLLKNKRDREKRITTKLQFIALKVHFSLRGFLLKNFNYQSFEWCLSIFDVPLLYKNHKFTNFKCFNY